jgi:hypothetical protein
MGMRLALHPNQRIVYGTDIGLSPSDIHHFDIGTTGAVGGGWDSPYHGDYALGGKVFIFPDASGVFSPAGVVLSTSASQTFDLKYLRTMPISGIADVAFDDARKIMASANSAGLTFYDYASNNIVVTRPLPGNPLFVGMRDGRAAALSARITIGPLWLVRNRQLTGESLGHQADICATRTAITGAVDVLRCAFRTKHPDKLLAISITL